MTEPRSPRNAPDWLQTRPPDSRPPLVRSLDHLHRSLSAAVALCELVKRHTPGAKTGSAAWHAAEEIREHLLALITQAAEAADAAGAEGE